MKHTSSLALGVSLSSTFAVLFLAAPLSAQATSWHLDDQQSAVRFTCIGSAVTDAAKGRFVAINGELQADTDDLRAARGAVGVLLASVTSPLPGWDAMFRNAGFLDLDQHPRATFEMTEVRGASNLTPRQWQRVRLVGALTVHGIRRELTLPARVRWTPASGDDSARLEVLTTFRIRWEDHEILVPRGWTRRFAGDAAQVRVRLVYRQ